MKLRAAAVLAVGLLGLLEAGCLVDVSHVKDPARAFDRARDEALRDARRGGRASHLNFLAWKAEDGEMVRVSVPLWLLREAGHEVDLGEVGDDHQRWLRPMMGLSWEELERAGPGVLLEVTEDETDRVLVWLR
jgi:hypothetical protein